MALSHSGKKECRSDQKVQYDKAAYFNKWPLVEKKEDENWRFWTTHSGALTCSQIEVYKGFIPDGQKLLESVRWKLFHLKKGKKRQ